MATILYELPYNIYILFFGVYVSMRISCGRLNKAAARLFFLLCACSLLIQGGILLLAGLFFLRLLYPWVVHLPLILVLVFILHARPVVSAAAVVISYSMCQPLRFIGLVLQALGVPVILASVLHVLLCHLVLLLFDRYILQALHDILSTSVSNLIWLCTVPAAYYLYEYFMLYTAENYASIQALRELMPTLLVLLYLLSALTHHIEMDKRIQAEQLNQALTLKLSQTHHELEVLRLVEERTAIYRHDLRHHLNMIAGRLQSNEPDQALAYILDINKEIDAITPIRYCENDTVNLLLCSFIRKAEEKRITVSVKASLPQELPLPDSDLCVLFSNALENALHAVDSLTQNRCIDIYTAITQGSYLLEVRNPYSGSVIIENGLPAAHDHQPHFGCRSIQSIAQRRNGLCSFLTDHQWFIVRVAIPLADY